MLLKSVYVDLGVFWQHLRMLNLNLKSRIYFTLATKDGNVCDDDGVEAGVQRSGLFLFIQRIIMLPATFKDNTIVRQKRTFFYGRSLTIKSFRGYIINQGIYIHSC
jgi:hypothetical protein